MALTREQKKKILEDLKEKIERQKAMIFIDFTGLKVKDLSDLRRKLNKKDCQFQVAKKTLMKVAFENYNSQTCQRVGKMKGEIALVFGFKDEIAPAKIVYEFSQENPNLKILGGFLKNKYKEAEEIITLAELPSREELLAKLVGSISAPASNFVNVLQGNIKGLILALNAISKSK